MALIYPILGYDATGTIRFYLRIASIGYGTKLSMTDLIMNGDYVRHRMKQLGLKQRDIAEAMGLPQSAISNIIKGKRRIKVEEADKLYDILKTDRNVGRDVPILLMEDVATWQNAREKTRLFAQYRNPNLSDEVFGIELDAGDNGMLSGLLHILVEPARKQLFEGGVYLVDVSGAFKFYRYFEKPSRLQPMAPFEGADPLFVGQSDFRVVGEVIGVFKRPDVLPAYGT